MKKLVKMGLVIPMALLVAVAFVAVPAIAAEDSQNQSLNQDLNRDLNGEKGSERTASADRNRTVDLDDPAADTRSASVGREDGTLRDLNERRGRQVGRGNTLISFGGDKGSSGGGGGGDEGGDEGGDGEGPDDEQVTQTAP